MPELVAPRASRFLPHARRIVGSGNENGEEVEGNEDSGKETTSSPGVPFVMSWKSGPLARSNDIPVFEWLCKRNRLRPEPIRFVRLDSGHAQSDGKSVNRGLPKLNLARGRDPRLLTKRIAASANEIDDIVV